MTLLDRTDTDGVAVITLNTPETLNALSLDMIGALSDAFDTIADDPNVRVIVLRGAGKAFCAGHNLREMQAMRQGPDKGAVALKGLFDACATMMQRIPTLPQPVIAQTHGIATAAGCQLVASCDMAVSADTCRFGVNGVNIGLFCSTPMVALSRNIPRKQAFEMLTTGDFIHADRALELGLINRIASAETLEADTMALATQVASKLGSAVRIGKRAFYDQLGMPLDAAYVFTGDVMLENMADEDTAEGIQAFIEKRAPNWS